MLKVYIDGGSRGNPGSSALGFVMFNEIMEEIYRFGKKIGHTTNNSAEYNALIEALAYIKNKSYNDQVIIYSDSELLVHQMNSRYRVKSGRILPLFHSAQQLMKHLPDVKIEHVRRDKNRIADWIVNRVLDDKPYNSAQNIHD